MNPQFCPKCNNIATYNIVDEYITDYKGYKVNVLQQTGYCKNCNERLLILELENKNLDRLYKKYRKVAGVVSPEEIIDFRYNYNISQRELSAILGWGKMTVNRYERGNLPNQSHNEVLKLIIKDNEYFYKRVENAYKNKRITEKTFKNLSRLVNICNKEEMGIINEYISEATDIYDTKYNIKNFNTTGVCVEKLHYIVNLENKINQIIKLIDRGFYIVIDRPSQFGKTTLLSKLHEKLKNKYTVIRFSFEGMGENILSDEKLLCKTIIKLLSKGLNKCNQSLINKLKNMEKDIHTMVDLDEKISEFIDESENEVILIIDEVDKCKNEVLIGKFLEMLKKKYSLMREGIESSFKSVVLAGIHDIRNINVESPFNIAITLDVDMSFSIEEISTMLLDYNKANKLELNIEEIATVIYKYTNGYPFLVSKVCQVIDEKIYNHHKSSWKTHDIQTSVQMIIKETNVLFDSIIKNIENNEKLYNIIKRILNKDETIVFNPLESSINEGITYGIFIEKNNKVVISNRIYEEILYSYIKAKDNIK